MLSLLSVLFRSVIRCETARFTQFPQCSVAAPRVVRAPIRLFSERWQLSAIDKFYDGLCFDKSNRRVACGFLGQKSRLFVAFEQSGRVRTVDGSGDGQRPGTHVGDLRAQGMQVVGGGSAGSATAVTASAAGIIETSASFSRDVNRTKKEIMGISFKKLILCRFMTICLEGKLTA